MVDIIIKSYLKKSSKDLGISEKISLIRDQLSLTADRLGEIAGISGTAISNIETGKSLNPGAETLANISSILGINLNWLVLGEGPMFKEDIVPATSSSLRPESVTREAWQKLMDRVAEMEKQLSSVKVKPFMKEGTSAFTEAWEDSEKLLQVYRLGGAHPGSRKLADRLSTTEEEARDLVLSGRIRATYVGKDNARARQNGISYFISEEAVREFLGDSSESH